MSATSQNGFIPRVGKFDDLDRVYELVLELAEYERLRHKVTGTLEMMRKEFAEGSFGLYVLEDEGDIFGYALTFRNFSTFRMQPGLWLEDLYVSPSHRGQGAGKAMLEFLISECSRNGYGRLEWSVLDWNESAIGFYRKMGAELLNDWRICRISFD